MAASVICLLVTVRHGDNIKGQAPVGSLVRPYLKRVCGSFCEKDTRMRLWESFTLLCSGGSWRSVSCLRALVQGMASGSLAGAGKPRPRQTHTELAAWCLARPSFSAAATGLAPSAAQTATGGGLLHRSACHRRQYPRPKTCSHYRLWQGGRWSMCPVKIVHLRTTYTILKLYIT